MKKNETKKNIKEEERSNKFTNDSEVQDRDEETTQNNLNDKKLLCTSDKNGQSEGPTIDKNQNLYEYTRSQAENMNRNFKNADIVNKTLKSKPLYIINTTSCASEETKPGWTNIPVVKIESKSDDQKSSVMIEEMEDGDELDIEENKSRQISPIIDEVEEFDDLRTSQSNVNQICFEEVFDFFEQEEMSESFVIQQSENKTNSAIKSTQIINLSFQRFLEVSEENCDEFILETSETELISSTTELHETKSLCPFIDVAVDTYNYSFCEIEEDLKVPTELAKKDEPESGHRADSTCCKVQATSAQGGVTNKQEIHFFIFLMFFIFLFVFHISSSSQNYSCFGENNEESSASCALDGFVELSRII